MTGVKTSSAEKEEGFIEKWLALEERLKAPTGKFKLIVCDKFDYSDATVGVFDTLEEALKARAEHESKPNDSPPHSLIEFIIYNGEGHVVEDSSFAYSVRQKRLGK